LAKQDEISSTEKLLELIRNNKRTQDLGPSAPQKIDPKEPISSRTKSSVKKGVHLPENRRQSVLISATKT
jgi:hypothetical protein